VLVEHVARSGGGKIYSNYEDFAKAIQEIMANQNHLSETGEIARKYVVDNYAFKSVKNNLLEIIDKSL
jgi:glycosyltransferase involved in cell wall biosynthesis